MVAPPQWWCLDACSQNPQSRSNVLDDTPHEWKISTTLQWIGQIHPLPRLHLLLRNDPVWLEDELETGELLVERDHNHAPLVWARHTNPRLVAAHISCSNYGRHRLFSSLRSHPERKCGILSPIKHFVKYYLRNHFSMSKRSFSESDPSMRGAHGVTGEHAISDTRHKSIEEQLSPAALAELARDQERWNKEDAEFIDEHEKSLETKHRNALAEARTEALQAEKEVSTELETLLESSALPPLAKRILSSDTHLRSQFADSLIEAAAQNGTTVDRLNKNGWNEAFESVIALRQQELEAHGLAFDTDGTLLQGETSRRLSEHDTLLAKELMWLRELLHEEPGTANKPNRLEPTRPLRPTAQPKATPPRETNKPFFNRVASKFGKFLAGVGLWLGGTSGGDFDQSSNQRAQDEQEPNRALPAYAAESPSRNTRAELPSDSIEFSEEESMDVMNSARPEVPSEMIEFSEEESEAVMKAEVAAAVRKAKAQNTNKAGATRAKASTVNTKRAAAPEGTKAMPKAAQDMLDAFKWYSDEVTKPKTRESVNNGGAANELLKSVPKAPEKRQSVARYKVAATRLAQEYAKGSVGDDDLTSLRGTVESDMQRGKINPVDGKKLLRDIDDMRGVPEAQQAAKPAPEFKKPVMARTPSKSRGLSAIQAQTAEGKKVLSDIDRQIQSVRDAVHRGELTLKQGAEQVRMLKDLK